MCEMVDGLGVWTSLGWKSEPCILNCKDERMMRMIRMIRMSLMCQCAYVKWQPSASSVVCVTLNPKPNASSVVFVCVFRTCACGQISNGETQIKIEREVCKERDGTEAMVVLPEGGVVVTGQTKP
jgi:hypothetical protein